MVFLCVRVVYTNSVVIITIVSVPKLNLQVVVI